MKNQNRQIIYGLIIIAVLNGFALFAIEWANQSQAALDSYGIIPEFNFVERSGDAFGKQQMLGKINVLNFFFTSCQGPCPYMNSKVAELYQKYVTSSRVQFISVSVDPDRDSLSVLKEYAQRYGVNDKRWFFLRGEKAAVTKLAEKGFMLAGDLPIIHSTKLILIDVRGQIRGYYDSFNEESLNLLTTHVRELLKEI